MSAIWRRSISVGMFAGVLLAAVPSAAFPTLLRATTQGLSIAITRALTALVALFTPVALAASAKGFFIAMFTLQVMAMVIGYFWIPRRPTFGKGDTVHEAHEATTKPSQPSTEDFDA